MAKEAQTQSSVIPKSSSYISLYHTGVLKTPVKKEEPPPSGRKALVEKYLHGERLKRVKSSPAPKQKKA